MLFYNNVIIIGAGGTGSRVIPETYQYLSNLDNFNIIKVFDGDKLELKNLSRQQLRKMPGAYKVNCLNVPRDFNKIKFNPEYVQDLRPFLEQGINLVLDCVDNHRSRKDHLDSLKDSGLNFIYISPGNSTYTGQVVSFAYINGLYTGTDPTEFFPEWKNPKDNSPMYTEGRQGCDIVVEQTPQLQVTNVMAATMTLHTIVSVTEEYILPTFGSFDVEKGIYVFTEVQQLQGYESYVLES